MVPRQHKRHIVSTLREFALSIVNIEVWRQVPGYRDYYEVSNLGNVRSVERTITQSNGRIRTFPSKMLKPRAYKAGHLSIELFRGSLGKKWLVHRLVLLAFRGKSAQGTRHLDGNPANNRFYNLRYGTQKENMADKKIHGTHNFAFGEDAGSATISNSLVRRLKRDLKRIGHIRGSGKRLAEKYGIKRQKVSNIKNGHTWNRIT